MAKEQASFTIEGEPSFELQRELMYARTSTCKNAAKAPWRWVDAAREEWGSERRGLDVTAEFQPTPTHVRSRRAFDRCLIASLLKPFKNVRSFIFLHLFVQYPTFFSREARVEFGEKIVSRLKLSPDGTKVLWPQLSDDPEDPLNVIVA